MPRLLLSRRVLMLLASALLLTGCAGAQKEWLLTPSPEIPALPGEARQPDPPSICSPTCSAGLSILLDSLLSMPIKRESLD